MSRKPTPKPDDIPEIVPGADGTFAVAQTRDNSPRQLRGVDGKPLRALSFRDEQDADGYHSETPVTGGRVAYRELSQPMLEQYYEQLKAIESTVPDATKNEDEAQAYEASGDFDKAAKLRLDAQKLSQTANREMMRVNYAMLNAQIAGWDFERPFKADAWRALRGEDIRALQADISQSSIAGVEDADFLALDSLAI